MAILSCILQFMGYHCLFLDGGPPPYPLLKKIIWFHLDDRTEEHIARSRQIYNKIIWIIRSMQISYAAKIP
jgi:hypothetical protein